MASFSRLLERRLGGEPGLEQGACPAIEVAPPWTFSSSPRSWRISRSRRTVMSETPSSRTRSATRTAAVLADAVEDEGLALAREHQAAPTVGSTTPVIDGHLAAHPF